MSISTEFKYLRLHLYNILVCWLYQRCVQFAHRFLYPFFLPRTQAFLDHEYKIIARNNETLLTRLWNLFLLLTGPGGTLHFFDTSSDSHLSRLRAERTDTPSVAFLHIVYNVHLPTASRLNEPLKNEIQNFWSHGITGASKPDHFLFGGRWHIKDIPDPREMLGNDPLLCAIAASTAEQMVEVFNWRMGLGVRRDLRMLTARKPYWDQNLVPCVMETAPEWCKDVGPTTVQTVVDREGGKGGKLESKTVNLSPSFKKRNLLASSQFMYFA